jgi:glycosyltransferase involved in cell wall biosynthesis
LSGASATPESGGALRPEDSGRSPATPDPPLVSIVIINHNYGTYLPRAIRSALEQTYQAVQIVVVDDGSTDNSRTVISSFGSRIAPVLQNQRGHVCAFNAGFAASAGAIIIFLDADDVLYANCVQCVVNAWKPGAVKIQYRLDTIDQNGVDQKLPFPYFPPDLGPEKVLQQAISLGVYPWTVSSGNAFARSFLEQLLPIPAERIFKSPDGYVNKMAPLFGAVHTLNMILGAYRVHGRNAWAQPGDHINPASLSRWVRFDALIHAEFVQRAGQAGYTVKPYDRLNNPQMLENRLLSLRLAPNEHPISEDRRIGLAIRGLRSAVAARNVSTIGRLSWMVWFLIIGGAPLPIVRALFRSGRGQSGRGRLARWVVSLSRGAAGAH